MTQNSGYDLLIYYTLYYNQLFVLVTYIIVYTLLAQVRRNARRKHVDYLDSSHNVSRLRLNQCQKFDI